MSVRIWSVTALNRELRKLLDVSLAPLWLAGEVSNLKIHQSGHVYFSLKDENGLIRAVMFSGAPLARRMELQNGMEVEVFGKVRIYETYGQYQIYVDQIRPGGLGRLQQEFEALKQKLQAEGLFDADRKRPIPAIPRCVGLVTSLNGAAMQDFFNVVERRFPGQHIRIIDARMQGKDSAMQVIRAIRYLNREQACDVIVITRGGGSMEDLWCFNDEELVRQVAASEIPVISAIGHEVDFTLTDFAADLRAPTPSAAAELVVGQQAELRERLQHLNRRLLGSLDLLRQRLAGRVDRARAGLSAAMTEELNLCWSRLQSAAGHYLFQQPELILQPQRQRVSDAAARLPEQVGARFIAAGERVRLSRSKLRLLAPDRRVAEISVRVRHAGGRLAAAVAPQLRQRQQELARLQSQLLALSPKAVLKRGYSILMKEGRAVRSAADVTAGDELRAILGAGEVDVEVKD